MSKPVFYGALSAQEVFFYPDMALDALPERLHIDLPLDGKPGVQLLLRTGGEAIRLTLEGGGFAAEYYAMRAVPVEYNTGDGTQQGGAMVLEQRPAQKPDYASRLAPFWVYDCLIEAPDGCIRAQDSLAAAYLCLCPDAQCRPGTYTMERLRRFIREHDYVDVLRFTTFFHQFTLVFDELCREKYVDWYGYSASVSPYILGQFEKEAGYKFRPEYIIDQGYYNNQYRVPSKEYKDFQAFQRREVAKLAKEMVDITHDLGKEAMMFLGDHWIGTEPFMPEFAGIGLDSVVGSVGNGSTLRLIADIPGVRYTEGRFLPYFFPDTFHPGGDPVREAKENWVTARRAILRKPIDRIGYGGYLKLACQFPDFIDYVESVCHEFRELYKNVKGTTPYCFKTVAVLNCWGRMRAWGCHMVHHALYQKQNYSYAGVIEALSGAAFDVRFLSFDDLKENPDALRGVDVLLNIGDGDTAHTGGAAWEDADVSAAIRRFVAEGGGLIGIGEPSGHQYQGHYLQLASVLGVEKETGFTLGYDKYNWDEHPNHFILADCAGEVNFGEGKKSIYALDGTEILVQREKEVQMAVHEYGKGRAVYLSGLPYSFENARLLHRAILWSSHAEAMLHTWFSENYCVEVHAYPQNGKYCVVNNTYEPQTTEVHTTDGRHLPLSLAANEIRWFDL